MAALDGKTCVITGATSGIGLATAAKLAAAGARLVLAGRDRARGEAAIARIKAMRPECDVTMLYADLSVLAGMRQLTEQLAALPRIDVLVNNAGAVFHERHETADGLELTFALNHMSYYMLSRLLLERLTASAPARIVNVASGAHRKGRLDFADLQRTRGYQGWAAYATSKLCNILFTRELARRIAGSGVTANCLHPGLVASRFGDGYSGLLGAGFNFAKNFVGLSVERGAETPAYLASSPEVADVSGLYFGHCRVTRPSAAARDAAAARRLWEESARIAGLS
jgi:NAD(P)-dependent dehydrogenase (short-subunit alcohol dehydrogenase family)